MGNEKKATVAVLPTNLVVGEQICAKRKNGSSPKILRQCDPWGNPKVDSVNSKSYRIQLSKARNRHLQHGGALNTCQPDAGIARANVSFVKSETVAWPPLPWSCRIQVLVWFRTLILYAEGVAAVAWGPGAQVYPHLLPSVCANRTNPR